MEKKNIYLVQPNYMYGNNAYLPYSVGAIAAYAWEKEEIKTQYTLKRMIYRREPLPAAAEFLDKPFLVGFSNYIWNFEYNKRFAQVVKENHPSCITVFGGHSIPSDSAKLLREHDFIDILIHDEGEIPFAGLLSALAQGADLQAVSNISYRRLGEIVCTNRSMITETAYPSPYLNGYFDEIIKEPGITFNATLETNRGCPFQCAYCDWGIYKSHLRVFPQERIQQEIQWMAEHRIELCMGADANFGILKRDAEIVEWLIERKQKYGYPSKFRVAYTKNSNQEIFLMTKYLNEYNMCKGATLSFQSLNPKVLKQIGRKNISLGNFEELMNQYHLHGIPTYSEIILGLPGETYESFCAGIDQLLESGQHTSINIYNCELLVNSQMGREGYKKRYAIKSVRTPLNQYHCEPMTDAIQEYSEIVIASETMGKSDWVRANCFAWAVQCFHCLGLLQFFAIYVHDEKKISYDRFYQQLLAWMKTKEQTLLLKIFMKIEEQLRQIADGKGNWNYVNEKFGKITWPFEEGAFLEFVYEADRFYTEIEEFLEQFEIEKTVYNDLMNYQKQMLRIPGKKLETKISCSYDIHSYFKNHLTGKKETLKRCENTIIIRDNSMFESWESYARQVVWYGRKGGKNLCDDVSVIYDHRNSDDLGYSYGLGHSYEKSTEE